MRRWVLAGGLLALAGLLAAKPPAADVGVPGRTTPRPPIRGQLAGFTRARSRRQGHVASACRAADPARARAVGLELAPDRSRLVLGSTARGARLRLIDLQHALAWRRCGYASRVGRRHGLGRTAARARRRRHSGLLRRWRHDRRRGRRRAPPRGLAANARGSLQAGERFRGGLLLVLGPRGRSVGPSRLVQVGPRGGLRSAALPEIRSGTESSGRVTESWDPGLAVDRSSGRAFVVQAQAPVAEVDLSTFRVRSHPLGLGARAADAVVGPTRHALWLGRGLLAVTGSDSSPRQAIQRATGAVGRRRPA